MTVIETAFVWLAMVSRNLSSALLDVCSTIAAAIWQAPIVQWLVEDCLRQVSSNLVADGIAAAIVCLAGYLWRRWRKKGGRE